MARQDVGKKLTKAAGSSHPGPEPLRSYEEITRRELAELRRMSVKEAIRRTEILLRAASEWKK